MTTAEKERFATALKGIAEKLEACEEIRKYDTADEKQAWTLAHAFLDLAESFRKFLDQQLPKLERSSMDCEQMNELLLDIGEEFRHILYHIQDPAFYAYLRESLT
jgi:hypothetical protein